MISAWILAVLILLCMANVFLLAVLAYSGRGKTDKPTKVGFGFMSVVLALDMVFSIGGVVLW